MKNFYLFVFFLYLFQVVSAQDPHFSQFFASPLTLNPAFTGKFDGNIRAAGNFRNQWPTISNAFKTETASVDFHIMQNNISQNDTWGVGFMAYNDNTSDGVINYNYASVSTAYHKGLDEEGNHQLGLGFQATYANMSLNTSGLRFEDQYTTLGFTRSTNEIFNGTILKANYLDINTGILYNGRTNEKNNFYFGVSLYHITNPVIKFTGFSYALNPRATIHTGLYFPLNEIENISLHLSAMQSFQGKASETVFGGALQFAINKYANENTSIYLGSWLRLNDAFIPYLGLEYNSFRIGATYDINTSSLKTASQTLGGIEVSLIYINRQSTDNTIKCPKF